MTNTLLEVTDLHAGYGRAEVLSGLNFKVLQGQVITIIGPNGAGKSTFFNLLSGSLSPTTGQVLFRGDDVSNLPQHEYARRGIAKSFQITNVFKQLSARENVRVALQMRRSRFNFFTPRSAMTDLVERADALLERVGLADQAGRQGRALSGGQQQRLALARAWARQPDVLLLDEPTASLDPHAKREVERLMDEFAAAGMTLVFASHNLGQVKRLASRVLYLEAGRLRVDASTERFFDRAWPHAATAFLQGELP